MVLFTSSSFVFSQDLEVHCTTNVSSEQLEFYKSIRSQLKSVEKQFNTELSNKTNSSNIVNFIPVKIHVLRYADGSEGISESDIDFSIDNLNDFFKGSLLEFFNCSDINYIDDDALAQVKKGEVDDLIDAHNVQGMVNIYFSHSIKNESDQHICGYSNNTRNKDFIFIKNFCALGSTLAHEMGHYFSLIHTHGADNYQITTELVDGSNCDTDGDGICDTPADPGLSSNNVNNFCEYTGDLKDAYGHTFKPDTKNIMSYSRKSCRSHFSKQQLIRMYAFYVTQKNYLACPDFNADFNVSAYATCETTLNVSFSNDCEGITNWEWDIDSDGTIDYTTKNPTHTFGTGVYDVTLTVTKKSKKISKTYHNLIKVGYYAEALFDETFDSFNIAEDNGWTTIDRSKSGYNWLINHGATTTKETGPLNDHSKQSSIGKYIYTEASGAKAGDIAEFISPCLDVVYDNSEIQFSYHMFGKNIGELHVDIETESGYILDVIDPLIGSQQDYQDDDFLTTSINLSPYTGKTIKIRFRAIRGKGFEGDIAIDDVFLKTIIKPISDESVSLYPNPVKNDLLFVKINNERNDNEILNYTISNLMGQTFSSGMVSGNPINTSDLSSGAYILTVSGEKSKVMKRFVK